MGPGAFPRRKCSGWDGTTGFPGALPMDSDPGLMLLLAAPKGLASGATPPSGEGRLVSGV